LIHHSDGDSRYERRHIDKQNAKTRAEAKQKETTRVRKLVEDAMKKDPRIKKQKQLKEEKIRLKKEEKERKKREKEEQEKREQEAQKLKQVQNLEAEKLKKKQQKMEREKMKKWRNKLRKYCNANAFDGSEEIEIFNEGASYSQLQELADLLKLDNSKATPSAENAASANGIFKEWLVAIKQASEAAKQRAKEAMDALSVERKKRDAIAAAGKVPFVFLILGSWVDKRNNC